MFGAFVGFLIPLSINFGETSAVANHAKATPVLENRTNSGGYAKNSIRKTIGIRMVSINRG